MVTRSLPDGVATAAMVAQGYLEGAVRSGGRAAVEVAARVR